MEVPLRSSPDRFHIALLSVLALLAGSALTLLLVARALEVGLGVAGCPGALAVHVQPREEDLLVLATRHGEEVEDR